MTFKRTYCKSTFIFVQENFATFRVVYLYLHPPPPKKIGLAENGGGGSFLILQFFVNLGTNMFALRKSEGGCPSLKLCA